MNDNKLKIGVFGAWRGNSYVNHFRQDPRSEVVAVCDRSQKALDGFKDIEGLILAKDFDTFVAEGKKAGMAAVFLANHFHQHAPFAIKAMEAELDVVSECTAAGTLKECVELVEAAERTGRKYILAENYPFSTFNLELTRVVKGGTLGTLQYAEGEYNHAVDAATKKHLAPTEFHWRNYIPRTYYVTHALGPIMYATDTMPQYVSARSVPSQLCSEMGKDCWARVSDGTAMMFCEMDNGMIARFTGCSAMGSDYSRYRICGDKGGVEAGHNIAGGNVRIFYHGFTRPENAVSNVITYNADLSAMGEKGILAAKAGHGGGDYWIAQNVIECFLDDAKPCFDVYQAVAMSTVGILGWRSCLNHGENFKIPDFRNKAERAAVRDDDLTPFPDAEGKGATLPCSLRG